MGKIRIRQKMADDNEEIITLLKARLELGRERYGHGMRVNDDTKEYGVESDDWILMGQEEILDGLVYTAAAMIRHMRKQNKCKMGKIKQKMTDDNEEIIALLKARLERERYRDGIRVNDDTKECDVESDDWILMDLEEILDGLIYTAAAMIRHMRKQDAQKVN